jgi:hypothetical protein
MATIILTWDNPSDTAKLTAMNEKAKEWRAAALKQPGMQSLQVFVHPFGLVHGMANDTLATVDDAHKFMASDTWRKIISEMGQMGATNIHAQLWEADPATPAPLRA